MSAFCTNCGQKLESNFLFCPECGKKIHPEDYIYNEFNSNSSFEQHTKICSKCGESMPEDAFYCFNCGYLFDDNTNQNTSPIKQSGAWKNKWLALLLCIIGGGLGLHKFYEGKIILGIIYIFTFGLLGIGWFLDIIILSFKPNPYYVT